MKSLKNCNSDRNYHSKQSM